MKKFLPLLAVAAITAALIAVAVTRGFGGFSTARTSGTCEGTPREIAACVKETCGNADQSPEYRECVQRARGTTGREMPSVDTSVRQKQQRRPAASTRSKPAVRRGSTELKTGVQLNAE